MRLFLFTSKFKNHQSSLDPGWEINNDFKTPNPLNRDSTMIENCVQIGHES